MAVKQKTYGNIIYNKDKGRWDITAAEPHVCIKLKAVFGKMAKWERLPFEFIDSPESCHDLKWFMERYPLEISEQDLIRMEREKKKHIDHINEMEAIILPDYNPKDVSLKDGYKAREYQVRGKDVFMKCKRLLIGDEVGLGKTLIGIISFLEPKTRPAIVTVQTHLQKQWKDEIEKFTHLTVHLIKGTTPYSLPVADVYIIKYSCLAGWTDF